MRTIDLSRLGIGAVLLVLCAAGWSPAAETVFHYSFDSADGLPVIVDRGPAMNDATAGDAAVLSDETPLEGVPDDAGDSSLDSSAGVTDSTVPSGVVTNNTLLLDNASVAAAGGFTMECWFLWYASAAEMRVNSIIDYAGTEKLTINTNRGNGLVEMQLNNAVFTPVGFVSPLEWHYVAAIFDTEGAAQNDDGTIDGTLRVYLDGIVPTNIVKATKSTFGDSLGRGIGVGTHPMGFASDFFDGLVYEPRVSLGPVALDDLLLQEAEPPTGTGEVFRYSFASTTVLPNIPDASGAGNGATAGGAAALSSDTPDSAPDDGGNRSLNTSGGAGAVTSGTGLLSNDAIESAGGFLMEVWFQWNGGGGVNSIIDYAGTDRIIIDTGNPMAGQVELEMSGAFIPLGIAIPGEWHYVAVIFSSGGRPRIPGGGIEGAVKVFFDQTILPAGFFAALKDTTGDGRNAGIGIGQNPLGGDAFDGLVYEPRVRLGVVGTDLLRYTVPTLEPGTLFKFSFVDGETILPDIEDLGPMGNDAVAGPGAVLVPGDIPTKGVPAGAGDSSLDTSLAAPNLGGEPPSGAVIGNTLLLSNTVVAQAGGFTMEAWVKYNGGGNVNSIIDYAGTEKMTIRGGVVTMQFDQPRRDYPIGTAVTGEWHYAAVVFDTGGAPQNGDGTVTGTVTTYFDSLAPTSVVAGVLKSNFGDSLVRGIGIGQHPLGYGGDFLDGSIFEPKVSLGA
ncbi:MAG: hypothetical protein JXA90_11445, partial [Planctomycetes bacterium]|nr:hypothetical protein [Planctomycetota bacterium]